MKRLVELKIRPAVIFGALTALIAYSIVATGPPTNADESIFIVKGIRLTTSANVAKVVLANGAQSCNIFWSFVTAATNAAVTLGFNTTMHGSILTDRDITLMDNVVVTGRLLTTSGKVISLKFYGAMAGRLRIL